MKRVGILALQGDFAAHARSLRSLGVEPCEVRRPRQLVDLHGLVMPGGESSTLLKLMDGDAWFPAVRQLAARGGSILATCAGAILLARRVVEPAQRSLGLLDATIRRNGYGRQIDSFEADIGLPGGGEPLRAVFIRAPRIVEVAPQVEVLARHGGEPVLVRQGAIVAATFHPELTDDWRIHRIFLDSIGSRDAMQALETVIPLLN